MAGEIAHIKGKGKLFSSTNQPANRGRKPKLYTTAKKGYDIEITEFREVSKYLLQCTRLELAQLADDPSTPVWVENIAKALLQDIKNGRMFAVNELFDRIFGKAMASVDITTNGKDVTPAYASIQVTYDGGEVLELKSDEV